jgi:hypothetical protein
METATPTAIEAIVNFGVWIIEGSRPPAPGGEENPDKQEVKDSIARTLQINFHRRDFCILHKGKVQDQIPFDEIAKVEKHPTNPLSFFLSFVKPRGESDRKRPSYPFLHTLITTLNVFSEHRTPKDLNMPTTEVQTQSAEETQVMMKFFRKVVEHEPTDDRELFRDVCGCALCCQITLNTACWNHSPIQVVVASFPKGLGKEERKACMG